MLNLSSKTDQGVKRSREAWFSRISHLFDRSSVEEDTWEELEELLIAADVGVATAEKLI
ncbi:MAG: signal recognition particle-docking protein FtsY, partial [Chloroflexi bacterium]|nr:signal recognition particle-docking protein FtsY [Chloroflexota bacterium]